MPGYSRQFQNLFHVLIFRGSRRWSFRMFYLQDELFERLSLQISATPIRFTEAFRFDPQLADKILELHKRLEGHCQAIEFEFRMLNVLEHVALRHAAFARRWAYRRTSICYRYGSKEPKVCCRAANLSPMSLQRWASRIRATSPATSSEFSASRRLRVCVE